MVIVGVGLSANQNSPKLETRLLLEEPLLTIKGNSLIGNNPPYIVEPSVSYLTLYGKSDVCPIEKQCVQHLKNKGLNIQGNAKDIRPNSNVPVVGGGILLYSGRWGHIAFVEKITAVSILVSEANFLGCGIVSTRSIDLDDIEIRGFVK